MSRSRITLALALAAGVMLASPALAAPSYENCTQLQKTYPHGVGKAGAKDKTSGKPVTTWKKDTAAYNKAMSANRGLDRDKDGIACEKK